MRSGGDSLAVVEFSFQAIVLQVEALILRAGLLKLVVQVGRGVHVAHVERKEPRDRENHECEAHGRHVL